MSSLGLIFVDQLSKNNLVYENIDEEDSLLFFEPMSSFYELPHHKQKLIYLITSLRKYIPTIRHERVIHEKVTENHQGLSKTLKRVFSEQQLDLIEEIWSYSYDFKEASNEELKDWNDQLEEMVNLL